MNPTHELMAVLALIMAVCALLYAVVATRKRSLLSHIAAVEAALTREVAALRVKQDSADSRLSQLPTGQEFTDIRVKLAGMEAKQEAVLTEAHGARAAIRRVEDFLLKAKRDHDSQF